MNFITILLSRFIQFIDFPDSIIKLKKTKLILRSFFALLFICGFLLNYLSPYSMYLLFITVQTIGLLGLLVTAYLTNKFFNWPLISFIFILAGIFYKRGHDTYSSEIMTTGTVFLGILCLFNALKISHNYKVNLFLRWFGFLTGLITFLFMFSLLYMNQHWNGFVRQVLGYSGSFIFLLTVLAMVFTLPFSNYVSWSEVERKVFFKTILIPMIFILGFFTLVFVLPDVYDSLTGRGHFYAPWVNNAEPYYLKPEGI